MRYFASLMLLAACGATQSPACAAAGTPFSISITCRSNPQCVFKGEKLYVNIAVENRSEKDVYLTTKYMRSRGPDIKVTDARTKDAHYTHVHVGDYELLADYELIPAKGRFVITDVIIVDDITAYRKNLVDLDVEVSFAGKWKFAEGKVVMFDDIGRFSIRSEDTLAKRSGILKK